MGAAAEIALARSSLAHVEGRLTSGLCAPKRRAAAHATIRALRVYVALLQAGFDLEQVIAALKAVGGGDCRPLVPATEQSHDVNHVLHGSNHLTQENECLSNGRSQ